MSTYCSHELFTSDAIVRFIKSKGIQGTCDYLQISSIVIELDVLSKHIMDCIQKKYEDAAECIPYESKEGGYLFDTLSIYEILNDEDPVLDRGSKPEENLFMHILDEIDDGTPYVIKNFFGPPTGGSDGIYNWNSFSNLLKEKQRYTSFHKRGDKEFSESDPVEDFLSSLSMVFRDDNILTTLKKEEEVYRARIDNENSITEYSQLSSPPSKLSNHNRFSPQGISFFYGAKDIATCIAEIRPNLAENVTIGSFKLIKDLQVADLVNGLGKRRSIYDSNYDFYFDEFHKPFLNQFIHEIAKPIRLGDAKLDYIPTQAFVECLRFVIDTELDGIIFKSSTNEGGVNVVLFKDKDILSKDDGWLEGVSIEKKLIKKISYSVK